MFDKHARNNEIRMMSDMFLEKKIFFLFFVSIIKKMKERSDYRL